MTRNVVTVRPDAMIREAAQMMDRWLTAIAADGAVNRLEIDTDDLCLLTTGVQNSYNASKTARDLPGVSCIRGRIQRSRVLDPRRILSIRLVCSRFSRWWRRRSAIRPSSVRDRGSAKVRRCWCRP